MKLLRSISELSELPGPIHLAIGVFDGVHLGHQAVIAQAVQSAAESKGTAVVVTFEPHPASVLRPGQAPASLTSNRHKLLLLASLGVTHTLVLPFDDSLASTPPADFILALAAACKPLQQICVGENWVFGKGRKGDVRLLNMLGQAMRFSVVAVPSVSIEGHAVSSTSIRTAIQGGEVYTAGHMLGRPYSIIGTVQSGKQLARQFGFPTANVRPECEQLPPDGVYVVEVGVEGEWWPGIANVGLRPTVEKNAKERLVEAHVFDWSGELVGHDLEIIFREFIRPEVEFDSVDSLRLQISTDARNARAIANSRP